MKKGANPSSHTRSLVSAFVGCCVDRTIYSLYINPFRAERLSHTYQGGSRISEKGVRMYKGMGVRFADFSHFSVKYPTKMKSFGLTATKLFHFQKIF